MSQSTSIENKVKDSLGEMLVSFSKHYVYRNPFKLVNSVHGEVGIKGLRLK